MILKGNLNLVFTHGPLFSHSKPTYSNVHKTVCFLATSLASVLLYIFTVCYLCYTKETLKMYILNYRNKTHVLFRLKPLTDQTLDSGSPEVVSWPTVLGIMIPSVPTAD